MMLLQSPLLRPLLVAGLCGVAHRAVNAQEELLLTTGLPRQTTYAELVLLMSELYNPGNCGGSYELMFSNYTFNNLVSISTVIVCNGQNFTIFGSGNALVVKFPVLDNNYTGLDLDTLQACGRTKGCFNLTYTGSEMPTYAGCDAFAQRSSGAQVANCTSCVACTTTETRIKMTIDCANVNSEFSTATDCVAPFTTNSSVMGVTPAQGGGGGGGSSGPSYGPSRGAAFSAVALFAGAAALGSWVL